MTFASRFGDSPIRPVPMPVMPSPAPGSGVNPVPMPVMPSPVPGSGVNPVPMPVLPAPAGVPPVEMPNQKGDYSGRILPTVELKNPLTFGTPGASANQNSRQQEAMAIAQQFINALSSLQPPIPESLLAPILDSLQQGVDRIEQAIRDASAGSTPEASQSSETGQSAEAQEASQSAESAQAQEASQSPESAEAQEASQSAESAQAQEASQSPESAEAQEASQSAEAQEASEADSEGAESDAETGNEPDTPPATPPSSQPGYGEGRATSENPVTQQGEPVDADAILKMLQDKRISATIRGLLEDQSFKQLMGWMQNP